MTQPYQPVLDFWYQELEPRQWFMGGAELDALIQQRFTGLLEQAKKGELDNWAQTASGRLALIIVLDQFSRQIYRDSAAAFAQDKKAQQLVLEGIASGMDGELEDGQRHFFYMPLMHAEDIELQNLSVEKFSTLNNAIDYARDHRAVIERFGRFPYRNKALGRDSTAEEVRFLNSDENPFK